MNDDDIAEATEATLGVTNAFGRVVLILGNDEGQMLLDPDTADALADGIKLCAARARAQQKPAGSA